MMKRLALKSCCAVILACGAAISAHAQSNVTTYGVLDIYVEHGKGDATTTSVNSGGLSGSRLGFKGTEDLGDGFKALFQIENGFAVDSGTITQGGVFWGRQALVGLSSDRLGTLTMGRQYTPQFIALDTDDPFDAGAGSSLSNGIVTLLAARANNSVYYESPALGDFSFSVMNALGEGVNPKFWSATGRFTHGPATVAVSWSQADTAAKASTTALSGAYDFGAVKLMGGVQQVKNLTGAVNVEDNRTEYFAGVLVPMGAGVANFGVGSGKTKNVADTRATQWSAGYTYNLSKRTSVYGVYTDINNSANTAYSADTATSAGPVVSFGHDVQALQVGLRHRF